MLKTSRFELRHLRREDLPQYLECLNHPDSKGDFLSQELMLPGVLEKKFDDESRSKEMRETFIMVDAEQRMIGQIFHFKTVPYFNSREIGYALFDKSLSGQGYMSEATCLLRDYLFSTLQINRLEIHMQPQNLASEKVAVRAGFSYDGIARGAVFSRGRHVDIAMYSLLRAEWEQLRSI